MVSKRLEDIVLEFIDEEGEESTHNYRRYLGFAIRGLRKLHLKFSGVPTFELCDVDENTMTITVPEDCIRVLTVAKITPDNQLNPLIYKEGIILNSDPSKGWGNNYRSYMTHYFGQQFVSGGAYKQDLLGDTIKVSSDITADCLYVEYLGDLKKIDGRFLVHPYNYEAIIAYIRWANIRSNPNRAMSEKQYYEKLWKDEEKEARRMSRAMTIQEVYDSYRKIATG